MSPTDIVLLLNLVLFAVVVFATYMFYARLRDIADELRKFRIAYEMAEDRKNAKASTVAQAMVDREG